MRRANEDVDETLRKVCALESRRETDVLLPAGRQSTETQNRTIAGVGTEIGNLQIEGSVLVPDSHTGTHDTELVQRIRPTRQAQSARSVVEILDRQQVLASQHGYSSTLPFMIDLAETKNQFGRIHIVLETGHQTVGLENFAVDIALGAQSSPAQAVAIAVLGVVGHCTKAVHVDGVEFHGLTGDCGQQGDKPKSQTNALHLEAPFYGVMLRIVIYYNSI